NLYPLPSNRLNLFLHGFRVCIFAGQVAEDDVPQVWCLVSLYKANAVFERVMPSNHMANLVFVNMRPFFKYIITLNQHMIYMHIFECKKIRQSAWKAIGLFINKRESVYIPYI